MNCERDKIYNYFSGLITDEKEQELIRAHLVHCETCQKYLKEFLLLKEELSQKETPPPVELFLAEIKRKMKRKKEKIFLSSLATFLFLFLITALSLIFLERNRNQQEDYLGEENYEEILSSLPPTDQELILKELSKEIKEEELDLLEESLYLYKDYYDFLFSLEPEDLKILEEKIKKGG